MVLTVVWSTVGLCRILSSKHECMHACTGHERPAQPRAQACAEAARLAGLLPGHRVRHWCLSLLALAQHLCRWVSLSTILVFLRQRCSCDTLKLCLRLAGGGVNYSDGLSADLPPQKSNEELLNHYERHTKYCPTCQKVSGMQSMFYSSPV